MLPQTIVARYILAAALIHGCGARSVVEEPAERAPQAPAPVLAPTDVQIWVDELQRRATVLDGYVAAAAEAQARFDRVYAQQEAGLVPLSALVAEAVEIMNLLDRMETDKRAAVSHVDNAPEGINAATREAIAGGRPGLVQPAELLQAAKQLMMNALAEATEGNQTNSPPNRRGERPRIRQCDGAAHTSSILPATVRPTAEAAGSACTFSPGPYLQTGSATAFGGVCRMRALSQARQVWARGRTRPRSSGNVP